MLFVHICTCVLYSRLQLSGTTMSWKVKAMGQPQHFLFVSAAFPGRTPFRCGPGASSRGAELIRMALIDSVAFEGATATGYFYIRIEVLEFDFDFACILHHPSLISIYDWSHEGMFFFLEKWTETTTARSGASGTWKPWDECAECAPSTYCHLLELLKFAQPPMHSSGCFWESLPSIAPPLLLTLVTSTGSKGSNQLLVQWMLRLQAFSMSKKTPNCWRFWPNSGTSRWHQISRLH